MEKRDIIKLIIGFIVLAAIVVGVFFIYRPIGRDDEPTSNTNSDTSIEIDPRGENSPVVPSPAPEPPAIPDPGPVPAPQLPAGPVQPQTKVFNSAIGNLELTIPVSWRVEEQNNIINFFEEQNLVGAIYIYSNVNDTLEVVEHQLKGSPGVSKVQKITIGSVTALEYFTQEGNAHSVVVLIDRTLYYIHGQMTQPEFLDKIRLR